MVKAIDHDAATGTVTTGWEAVKGAAKWLLGPPVIGGVAGGLIGFAMSSGAIALSPPVVIGAVLGVVAGGAVSATLGSWMAGIGAVLGFAKGRERVHEEQRAFDRSTHTHSQIVATQLQKAQIQGANMGYAQGVQDGQAMVVEQLRQMQYAAIKQQMDKSAAANHELANAAKPECKHVEAEMKRREAAASNTQSRA